MYGQYTISDLLLQKIVKNTIQTIFDLPEFNTLLQYNQKKYLKLNYMWNIEINFTKPPFKIRFYNSTIFKCII